jgi:hypothetical protein
MPRAGQTKPPVVPRLPDRIAIGVLTRTFPPELVDRVLARTGRGEQRRRLLPARVVVYYTLAMCLFTQVGYEEVMRLLWRGWRGPGAGRAAGRSRTRARSPGPGHGLGRRRCGRCLWRSPGRWRPGRRRGVVSGWRLVALDGTTLDVPDTPANLAAFGRPGGGRGQGRSRRCAWWGWWGWWSAAPMRWWTRPWAGCTWARARWRPRSGARWGWGCCCWSTRACAAWSCGAPSRPQGRSWCGAAARTSS